MHTCKFSSDEVAFLVNTEHSIKFAKCILCCVYVYVHHVCMCVHIADLSVLLLLRPGETGR